MTEQDKASPDAGGAPAGSGSSGASPIDPNKVMADALKSIVNRADVAAGVPPGTADASSGDAATGSDGKPATGEDGTKRRVRKRKRKRRGEGGGPVGTTGGAGGVGGDVGPGGRGGDDSRRRGKKQKHGGSAMGHAGDAMRAMSAMLRRLLDTKEVHFLSRPRYMELNIKLPLDAGRDGPRCASQMVDGVLQLIEDVRKNEAALAPGSVYCYFSESAEAEACRPDEPRKVFDGYGSTGRPKFTDFVTMAIERKAKGIEGLVGGDDVTLTHVTQGRVLRTAQLQEFGKASPVYRILGQIDAGLFAVRGQDVKAAFSFQVLLGKDLQGQPVLRLHPVGFHDVMDLADHSVPQILQRFQGDLDEASLRLRGQQANGEEPDEEEFVLPMLQELAKKLEDRAKHRARRTEHAEKRAAKSDRPTNKAYNDAQGVSDADLLYDEKESTIIVVGPHHRVHVFTPEGRHVTSLPNIGRSGVQQRLKSHRWRATEPSERGEFRMQLRAMLKSRREEAERTNIERKERSDKAADSGASASPSGGGGEPEHLQSKIAELMSGLGGGAAKPPETPEPGPDSAPSGESTGAPSGDSGATTESAAGDSGATTESAAGDSGATTESESGDSSATTESASGDSGATTEPASGDASEATESARADSADAPEPAAADTSATEASDAEKPSESSNPSAEGEGTASTSA